MNCLICDKENKFKIQSEKNEINAHPSCLGITSEITKIKMTNEVLNLFWGVLNDSPE